MTGPASATLSAPPTLVRLAVGAAAVTAGAVQKGRIPLPAELIICPWGANKDLAGNPVIVDDVTLATLSANQTRYGFDEVALDFGHNTTPPVDADGNPLPAREPLPIAAMGKLSVVTGKGIVFTPTSWTPEGEQYYCGRHYKDLSPTVGKDEKGSVNFIHSIALTRAGQIANLHAYSAGGLPALTALQTTTTMDTNTATDYKALLLQKLGIDPAATDEQIIAACETPAAPVTAPLAVVATPEVTALAARLDLIERNNLVAEAGRAGKVIGLSDEALKLTPLAVLQELVKNAPVTVPLSSTTPANVVTLPTIKALSADEKAVAAQFGYTDEQWRKYNPA